MVILPRVHSSSRWITSLLDKVLAVRRTFYSITQSHGPKLDTLYSIVKHEVVIRA